MAAAAPTQKFGYLDIKQSSKVRPRKLKSWKRRWAVLTKMSDLTSDEYVAKLDLYDNENKWRSHSSDKTTFVIENVTSIRQVKSKTHQYAFEVIEDHPVLVMSGSSELESYSWILALQQIFTPEQLENKKDCYQVTVSANEDSRKWNLSGPYILTVSSSCISLRYSENLNVISWGLNSLRKFNVKPSSVPGQMATLVIECGPNAPTGQSCFHFLSSEAQDILDAIKQSICTTLALKQNARNIQSTRQRSLSATVSEKNFQKLLDHHPTHQSLVISRSDSGSSNSTTFGSPTLNSTLLSYPGSNLAIGQFSSEEYSLTDKQKNIHTGSSAHVGNETGGAVTHEQVKACSHKRSSSHPHKGYSGYSEIKELVANHKPVSRRNTLCGELIDFDIDRLRSVSAVVASLQASREQNSGRPFQENNEDRSDMDSAISSMVLSTVNDEYTSKEKSHKPDSCCTEVPCSCSFAQRRSSSTPDLQTYWKMYNSMASCENVYEELDDLRASVKRLNKKLEPGAPPQLPARPFTINFTYNADLNRNNNATMGQSQSDDVKYRTVHLCTCDSLKHAKSPSESGIGKCAACKHEIVAGLKKTIIDKTSSNRKMVKSPFSDINDINAIILQVQSVKLRRSSDVTPVNSSFLLPPHTPDNKIPEQDCFQTCEKSWERSLWSSAQDYLINLQERSDNLENRTVSPRIISEPVKSYTGDPSAHFFLDNESFDSNTEITEESLVQLQSSQSTFGFPNVPPPDAVTLNSQPWPYSTHVTKSSHSFPDVPALNAVTLTQTSRTLTWHGQNTDSCMNTSMNFPVNSLNSLDIWGTQVTSSNNGGHASGPAFFPDPFS